MSSDKPSEPLRYTPVQYQRNIIDYFKRQENYRHSFWLKKDANLGETVMRPPIRAFLSKIVVLTYALAPDQQYLIPHIKRWLVDKNSSLNRVTIFPPYRYASWCTVFSPAGCKFHHNSMTRLEPHYASLVDPLAKQGKSWHPSNELCPRLYLNVVLWYPHIKRITAFNSDYYAYRGSGSEVSNVSKAPVTCYVKPIVDKPSYMISSYSDIGTSAKRTHNLRLSYSSQAVTYSPYYIPFWYNSAVNNFDFQANFPLKTLIKQKPSGRFYHMLTCVFNGLRPYSFVYRVQYRKRFGLDCSSNNKNSFRRLVPDFF